MATTNCDQSGQQGQNMKLFTHIAIPYCMAINFRGLKFSWISHTGKHFVKIFSRFNDRTIKNFDGNIFKVWDKSAKVLAHKKFSPYGIRQHLHPNSECFVCTQREWLLPGFKFDCNFFQEQARNLTKLFKTTTLFEITKQQQARIITLIYTTSSSPHAKQWYRPWSLMIHWKLPQCSLQGWTRDIFHGLHKHTLKAESRQVDKLRETFWIYATQFTRYNLRIPLHW